MLSPPRNKKLLKLRPNAEGVPLVFAPDFGGSVLYSRDLVSRLSSGICPFALPLTQAALVELDTLTMESLAKEFAAILADEWPDGPLHLAGFSFAGLLAFETARALKALGRPVTHIWLFDTRAHRLHMPSAIRHAPRYELKSLVTYSRKKLLQRGREDENTLTSYRLLEVDLNNRPKAHRPIIRSLHNALSKYRPKPLEDMPVTLFRIEEKADEPFRPHALGWDRLTKGQVHIEIVDGEHLTIMKNPNSLERIGGILAEAAKSGEGQH